MLSPENAEMKGILSFPQNRVNHRQMYQIVHSDTAMCVSYRNEDYSSCAFSPLLVTASLYIRLAVHGCLYNFTLRVWKCMWYCDWGRKGIDQNLRQVEDSQDPVFHLFGEDSESIFICKKDPYILQHRSKLSMYEISSEDRILCLDVTVQGTIYLPLVC